jgi:hypothetical protein
MIPPEASTEEDLVAGTEGMVEGVAMWEDPVLGALPWPLSAEESQGEELQVGWKVAVFA